MELFRMFLQKLYDLWFIKTKRRRVLDAVGPFLDCSALHGVVFDRYERPGNGRESSTAEIQT
jgi:hypothetical protein